MPQESPLRGGTQQVWWYSSDVSRRADVHGTPTTRAGRRRRRRRTRTHATCTYYVYCLNISCHKIFSRCFIDVVHSIGVGSNRQVYFIPNRYLCFSIFSLFYLKLLHDGLKFYSDGYLLCLIIETCFLQQIIFFKRFSTLWCGDKVEYRMSLTYLSNLKSYDVYTITYHRLN